MTKNVKCFVISGGNICTCSQPFACDGSWTDFVGFSDNVKSEIDCQNFCAQRRRCQYYTWFSELDTRFSFYCFLYSACHIEDTGCVGCRSGPSTCFKDADNWEQIFGTTTTSTSTTACSPTAKPTTPLIPSESNDSNDSGNGGSNINNDDNDESITDTTADSGSNAGSTSGTGGSSDQTSALQDTSANNSQDGSLDVNSGSGTGGSESSGAGGIDNQGESSSLEGGGISNPELNTGGEGTSISEITTGGETSSSGSNIEGGDTSSSGTTSNQEVGGISTSDSNPGGGETSSNPFNTGGGETLSSGSNTEEVGPSNSSGETSNSSSGSGSGTPNIDGGVTSSTGINLEGGVPGSTSNLEGRGVITSDSSTGGGETPSSGSTSASDSNTVGGESSSSATEIEGGEISSSESNSNLEEGGSSISDSNTVVDLSFADANSSGTTLEGADGADFSSNLTGGKLTGPLSYKVGGTSTSAYKIVNQNDNDVALKVWCPGGAGSEIKYVGNNNTDHWFQLYDEEDKNPVTPAKFAYQNYSFTAESGITYEASDAHYFEGDIHANRTFNFARGTGKLQQFKISPNGNTDYATNIYSLNNGEMRFRTSHTNKEGDNVGSHIILKANSGVPQTKIYNVVTPTSPSMAANKAYVDAQTGGGGVPIGTVVMWLAPNPPDGWLICDGSSFDIKEYAALHTHLNTIYNYTTGKTPDFRGLYPGGAGSAHNNQLTVGSAARANVYFSQRTAQPNGGPPTSNSSRPTGNVRTFAASGNTNAYSDGISKVSISEGWDAVTRPPTLSVHFIIKAV